MTTASLIINGKKAGQPEIRWVVHHLRAQGHDLHVRVTWEFGNGLRYVQEAGEMGVDRVIAGGTVNEISHGLALIDQKQRPAMSVLPLGTANDFATGCAIPNEPPAALQLALEGAPVNVDLVQANDRFFLNVASAGFGAYRIEGSHSPYHIQEDGVAEQAVFQQCIPGRLPGLGKMACR